MSPRAAWRLERLGFGAVYDYVAGKMDWLSFGLRHEGTATLAGNVAERNVPTADIDATAGKVRGIAEDANASFCVIVNHLGVVMGVAQGDALDADPSVPIEEVMDFGISTVRPAEEAGAVRARMRKAHLEGIILTRSDGTLFGLLLDPPEVSVDRGAERGRLRLRHHR